MIRKIPKLLCVCVCAALTMISTSSGVCASGGAEETLPAAKSTAVSDEPPVVTARCCILTEMQTGTVLFAKNAEKQESLSHFAKLMTLLLLAERVGSGKLSLTDTFTVSAHANSQGDPQIWLDRSEKISVDELIKAITVGNANDAAVTIAEGVSGNGEKFVKAMNDKASRLGMSKTLFRDPTGSDPEGVTTAADLSKLCAEVSKHAFLGSYLKTWLTTVRSGKTELLNSNRLVRTYSGITGMKAFGSQKYGSCACVTADKLGMKLCAVVIGCPDNDKRDADVRKLLKYAADEFSLYTPKIPEEILENIPVTHGETRECELEAENTPPVVIRRGTAGELRAESKREEILEAPVEKGRICAVYSLYDDKKCVFTVNIVSANSVGKMNWQCAVKKLLYNLIKL